MILEAFKHDKPVALLTEQREKADDLTRTGFVISTRVLLIGAMVASAFVRIAWSVRFNQTIENEGAEYGRIAESLLSGRGYVGMYNNGTQMGFPPLYPLMIAAVSYVTHDTELTQRILNIIFGAALVFPMFAIANLLYGRRVAWVATVLAVFHPVLIAFGASTYSEGPYVTLLMAGLFFVMKYVTDWRVTAGVAAGVSFGLAYLIRPEGSLFVGAFAACGLLLSVLWLRKRRNAVWVPLSMCAAFAVVALPYVLFLTVTTGSVRLEAKGPANYLMIQRMHAGMSLDEAGVGIGADLSPQGVFVRPTHDVLSVSPPSIREYLQLIVTSAPRNAAAVGRMTLQTAFGSPILPALVILGFARGWDRQRMLLDGIMLVAVGVALFVVVMIPPELLWFRYLYPLLALVLIWAAKGADVLYEWGRISAASITNRRSTIELVGGLCKWGAIAAMLAISFRATPYVEVFQESRFPEFARAGRWIQAQSQDPATVMDTTLQIPYYAGAYFSPLPYADSDVTLQYIAKLKPNFIVLHSASGAGLPYDREWFRDGIPDERAVLVYDDSGESSPTDSSTKLDGAWQDQIKIYRWVPKPA